MNKKEISEIKKLFKPEASAITKICGCYVDGDKQIKCKTRESFHMLSEDEAFKYFEILKKSMSGTLGKNLLNLEFPLEAEKEGGTQEFLLRLRDSQLEDETLLDEFYQKVIESYDYISNYYIVLVHAMYDVPGKSSSGDEMFDASDEVYNYILCSICPVNLEKASLYYDASEDRMSEHVRDWIVGVPSNAFLFPAFNDRSSDIHAILYYSKNAEKPQSAFLEDVIGANEPQTPGSQKELFHSVITETLGEDCDYDVMKNIHENLNEMIEKNQDDLEPFTLSKYEVRQIFEESGVSNENMEVFDEKYDETIGENTPLVASNIAEMKKFHVTTPDVIIKVNSDRTDLIETRIIDGRQCLVIAVDDHIEVNGVNVRTLPRPRTD